MLRGDVRDGLRVQSTHQPSVAGAISRANNAAPFSTPNASAHSSPDNIADAHCRALSCAVPCAHLAGTIAATIGLSVVFADGRPNAGTDASTDDPSTNDFV